MKLNKLMLAVCCLWVGIHASYAKTVKPDSTKIQIKGQQAKMLYKSLTGPYVQAEGAAGHAFKNGKSVICRYTQVEMDDPYGKPIPFKDARRYVCLLHFDRNGLASPG